MNNPLKFRLRSFSTRISLWMVSAIAVILTMLIVFLGFFYFVLSGVTEVRNAENELRATNDRISSIFVSVETMLNSMEWAVHRYRHEPDSMYSVTSAILERNPYVYGSAVAFEPFYHKEKGRWFAPYSCRDNGRIKKMQLGNPDYEYKYMDWYQIPFLLKKGYWSEPYFDDGGGNTLLTTYSLPLIENGEVYGVFTADIALDWLTRTVNEIKPYEDSYSFIIDRNGTYIVHPDTDLILSESFFTANANATDSTIAKLGQRMISGKDGPIDMFITEPLDGNHRKHIDSAENEHYSDRRCVFYTRMKPTGWSVAVVHFADDIFENSLMSLFMVGIVFIIILVILWLVCWRIARHFSKPLEKFAQSAESVAKGDFTADLPVIRSDDEMRRLRDSFEWMQSSLVTYIDELRQVTSSKERIESELRIARQIQMDMIPKTFPPYPDRNDIDIFAALIPAKEVGGDLYDFFLRGDSLSFIVGDVAGKGVPASLVMAVVRTLFRTVAAGTTDPTTMARTLNTAITDSNESNMFVTAFVGVVDLASGKMEYCNCGHNAPLLVTDDGGAGYIDVLPNVPLGIIDAFGYESQTTRLPSGAILFMYTDGLTEAENLAKALYGEERLAQTVKAAGPPSALSPRHLTDTVLDSVHTFVGNAEQSDDLTVLAIKHL